MRNFLLSCAISLARVRVTRYRLLMGSTRAEQFVVGTSVVGEWSSSMEERVASDDFVVGQVGVTRVGVRSRFRRRDGRFFPSRRLVAAMPARAVVVVEEVAEFVSRPRVVVQVAAVVRLVTATVLAVVLGLLRLSLAYSLTLLRVPAASVAEAVLSLARRGVLPPFERNVS